ncbi:hypothetical protein GGE20_002757 [Rhizobium leguminosarum]|nr:hypothetical protein [Rhizobium leguminosarum]
MLKAMLKSPGAGPAERQMRADVANATEAADLFAQQSLRHVAIDDNCPESRAIGSTGIGRFKPCRILSPISKPMSHYNQAAAMPGD